MQHREDHKNSSLIKCFPYVFKQDFQVCACK